MSNALFPTLPGLSWGSTKEPMWTTQAKRSASGMEQRAGYMSYPLYRIKLSYEFLRAGAEAELQTLVGFFNQRGGDLESFLWLDPSDSSVTEQQFGVGDGTTTVFRLGRTLGGAYEPVSAVVDAATADPYRNYLTYPEQFDHATWTQTPNADVDVTANATTSPTGAVVAEKVFEATTANVLHQIAQTFVSAENTTYVFSTYVKAAERTRLALYFRARNGSYPYAVFNLVTGAVTEQSAGVSAGIESIGDGWYRCYISANLGLGSFPGAVYIELRQPTGGTTYAGTVGSGLYVWGAQVEQRSAVGAYTPTTTTAITNYIPQLRTAPVNEPRFDFNPITRVSLGLLMEQQSVNLLTYSSDYTNAAWTKNNTTAVAATNISPDGTLNAQSIVENTATATHQLQVGTSQASNTTVTASIFFKSNGRPVLLITVPSSDFSGSFSAFFNATTGLVGTTSLAGTATFSSATMTSVGNGWYRCRISGQASTTASTTRIHMSFGDTEALTSSGYAGNGYSGIFAWGAQLEATGFPTSYIPTVASQVTRTQDFATMTGTNFSSWFNSQQGSVYCSFDMASIGTGSPFICPWSIDNGSSGAYNIQKNSGNTVLTATQGSAVISSIGSITAINTTQQSIYTYNNTSGSLSFTATLNGATVSSTTPAPVSFLPTQVSLGSLYTVRPLTGHIRKFAYYPIATTSAQMQSLTGS